MTRGPYVVTRIAVFAALIYVMSLVTVYLPNVKLIFFLIFTAGFLWGVVAGMLVGFVGMGLWTLFNPYGPADIPVMVAQIIGAGMGGIVGAVFQRSGWQRLPAFALAVLLGGAGITCTLIFYIPVTVIDAWIYQPFWPRLIAGLPWVGISLVSNLLVFPLLFGAARFLYNRENRR